MLQKNYISNKCCSFDILFINNDISFHKNTKQYNFLNVDYNVSWAANQLRVISEDHVTEDWSNDAENTALQ